MRSLNFPTLFLAIILVFGIAIYANLNSTEIYEEQTETVVPSAPETTVQDMQNQALVKNTVETQKQPATKITNPAPKPKKDNSPSSQQVKTSTIEEITCTGNMATQILCEVNKYRQTQGLNSLKSDSSLSQVASSHSTWMNSTETFSHTGINGSKFSDRCADSGILCRAENLAQGYKSALDILNAWKANPGHNKNLLGPYSIAGIGISGNYVSFLFN